MSPNNLSKTESQIESERLQQKCKELETALRSSIQQLRALAEEHQILITNASEFVYRRDPDGVFHYLSPAVERITGYSVEEWKKHYTAYTTDHPCNKHAIECSERAIRTGETGPPYRVELFHRDGTPIMIEVHEKPFTENEKVLGIIGVARDITEQVRAEEDRRQLEFQVRHTQKLESLGVLAGGIAHDFNNLLASIQINAEILQADYHENPETLHNIDSILQATHHAAALCRQMLTYAGKNQVALQKVDLNALTREFAKLLVASVSKKARLEYHFAKELPMIEADTAQIQQIIVNLITNAAEALDGQPGKVTISTGVKNCSDNDLRNPYIHDPLPSGKYVFFEAADTGMGMDELTLERIFEPFFSTKFTGRGLGLSAVLGIVRGHKGSIQVQSQLGKGTTIRVYFPAQNHHNSASLQSHSLETASGGHGTILLVDDDELLRGSLVRMLKRAGFHVFDVASGARAIEILRNATEPIHGAIVDFTMPDMDGEEVIRALRRLQSHLPAILVSGYNEDYFAQRFIDPKDTEFLSKPFDSTQLITKLNKVLGSNVEKS